MRHHLVSSPADALAYITECTLATIEQMALHKRRPKLEWERQIAIAQHGLLWMAEYGAKVLEHDRAYEALNAGSVRQWAENLIANIAVSGGGTPYTGRAGSAVQGLEEK